MGPKSEVPKSELSSQVSKQYLPFTSQGYISVDAKVGQKTPITILQDTGASLLL